MCLCRHRNKLALWFWFSRHLYGAWPCCFFTGKKITWYPGACHPDTEALKKPVFAFIKPEHLIYGGTLLIVPLVVTLFNQYQVMDYIMFGLGCIALIYILSVGLKLEKEAKLKLFAALTMIIFSIVFWAVYEQSEGSMNLLAERNSKMFLFGIDLPELSVNNFLPPGWVVALTFIVAPLWPWLNKRGKEPSTPLKFALSFIFVGAGFFVFYLGCLANESTGYYSFMAFCMGIFLFCSWVSFAYRLSGYPW